MTRHRLIELPQISDTRGKLTFIEEGLHIPFEIRRVFYIYEVPSGQTRAGHERTGVDEVLVAVSGKFELFLDFGQGQTEVVKLDHPARGVYLPGSVWRELRSFSSGAVCLVLASERYDPARYGGAGDVPRANAAQLDEE